MNFKNTQEFAQQLDDEDELKHFRDQFFIPKHNGKDRIYFTGNSLGLQPKTTKEYVFDELNDWATLGVEGHFKAKNPWLSYHEMFPKLLAKISGCKEDEVVVMNQLTVNLHLLMVSFYRPTKKRYKIICEAKAFPSDQYALQSQVQFHGFNADDAIIEVFAREGEDNLRTEDIIQTIKQNNDSVALVLFGGVNYYTGQLFNIEAITKVAHEAGAYAGFDLAHAIGNVELHLHDWNVDFACWCSYKYLNSGPGSVSGVFIHENHFQNTLLKRFAGWWGHTKEERFSMPETFKPIPTAEGWQLSNAPILSMAAHKAALDIFEAAGMQKIIKKSKLLSAYTFFMLNEINNNLKEKILKIITPENEAERGCQLSLLMLRDGKRIFDALSNEGIITDWREPDVIRIAPVPLYNSFEDVWQFANTLQEIMEKIN